MYEVSIDNELYSKLTGVTKDTVTCNPSEFMNMNILLDYLPAVYSGDDNRYTSKGLACFLASVNSDKNTVPKLRINLNEQFVVPTNLNEYGDLDPNRKYTTERISYKSAKPNQILYSIKQNLGKFYSNVLYKIVNDF
jgi:endoglucanase Acf2